MHWDVVEIKPEPRYCLFVRFKDGVAGRLQLRPEELTGAIAPLLDAQFFEQVYVDYGAIAWPGRWIWRPAPCMLQSPGSGTGRHTLDEAKPTHRPYPCHRPPRGRSWTPGRYQRAPTAADQYRSYAGRCRGKETQSGWFGN